MSFNTFTVRFAFDRETKNTVRFAEVNDKGEQLSIPEAEIGTLYIKKRSLQRSGGKLPTMVTATIHVDA